MEIVMSGDPSELSMNWRLIIKGINKEIFYLKVLVALYVISIRRSSFELASLSC